MLNHVAFNIWFRLLGVVVLTTPLIVSANDAWVMEHEAHIEPCSVLLNEDCKWKVVVSLEDDRAAEIAFPCETAPHLDDLYDHGVHFEARHRSGPVETRLHAFVERLEGDPKAHCQQFMQKFFDRLVISERRLKPQISSKVHTLFYEGQEIPCYSYRADFSPWSGRQAVSYFNVYVIGDQVITVSANVMWSPWRVTPKERDWVLARSFLEGIRLTSHDAQQDDPAESDGERAVEASELPEDTASHAD